MCLFRSNSCLSLLYGGVTAEHNEQLARVLMQESSAPLPEREYSLVLLKPDAIERDICTKVLQQIEAEARGRVRSLRIFHLTPELLNAHYPHLLDLTFFPRIRRYMLRNDVWAAIIEGSSDVIQRIRDVLGATDPREATPGTIRHQYGRIVGEEGGIENVAHAADSQAGAFEEIRRFFPEEQVRRDVPEIADRVFGVRMRDSTQHPE